ncbi:MAG: hypothetical protein ACPHCJ_13685, partial [Oceanococcaceae bacterium]
MEKLLPYLKLAVEKDASDIFFTNNSPPMLKVDGEFFAVGKTQMTSESLRALILPILTEDQREFLKTNLEIDLAT